MMMVVVVDDERPMGLGSCYIQLECSVVNMGREKEGQVADSLNAIGGVPSGH